MYAKLYSKYFYPFYDGILRRRDTFRLLREYEVNQWRSTDELRLIQWEKLRKLIAHVYEHVPYYRMQFERIGFSPADLNTPSDMQHLPFLSKKDIRENQGDMLANNSSSTCLFSSWTGGSTGVPIKFKYDRYSYECRIAASARADRWSGWEFGVRELYIWGVRATADSLFLRWKKNIHHLLLRRKIFNSYLFSAETLPRYVDELNTYKPEIIVGYAGTVAILAQFIKEKGRWCHSPRAVIATAEQISPEQRDLIESVFQAPVFNRYGSREFMIIGMECDQHDGLHLNIDNQYIEVLKDGKPVVPGEVGEVVITDLNNYAMPFVRYKIGDLGVLSDSKCSCGRGLPLLKSVNGRIMDAIKTRDGRCVTGLFFTHLMKDFEEIRQFRVIQKSYDALEIEFVRTEKYTDECLQYLRREIGKILGDGVGIIFRAVPEIRPLASGKQRITFSELPVDFGNR